MGEVARQVRFLSGAVPPEVLDPLEFLGAGSADHPHHPVALGEEEIGQVGASLAGNAVVEGGGFPHRFSFRTSRKKDEASLPRLCRYTARASTVFCYVVSELMTAPLHHIRSNRLISLCGRFPHHVSNQPAATGAAFLSFPYCLRCHAIVRSSPSRNAVFARKPNSRSARVTSRQRLG